MRSVPGRLRIRPLSLGAAGLLLVAFDLRTRSLDYLPDVAGWLLVAAAAWLLGEALGAALAVAAGGLSLAELLLPYHLVAFNPATSEYLPPGTPVPGSYPLVQRWDELSGLRGGAIAGAMVVGALATLVLLRRLRARAAAVGDEAARRELRWAASAPLVWAAIFAGVAAPAVVGDARYDPVWDGAGEAAWLLALAALVGLALLLVLRRDRAWAFVASRDAEHRWDLGPLLSDRDAD